MNNGAKRGLLMWIAIIAIVGVCIYAAQLKLSNVSTQYTPTDLAEDLKEGTVASVVIKQNEEVPTGKVLVTYDNHSQVQFYTANVQDVIDVYNDVDSNAVFSLTDVARPSFIVKLVPYIIIAIAILLGITLIMTAVTGAANGGNNGKMANFGKSRAKLALEGDNTTTFKDVAGLEEEKEELSELVDFLKNPKKYIELGARIPTGVLLEGPPGTGKTLLAKAVAGEAGVPFYSISGSDFVEMFVGVGASRVRDLFEEGKKNAPCIVFIDEIDAVARRRGSGLGGGHDEREQTLNQMLVEMDGFGIGRPDVKGRREILDVHTKQKPLGEDVDLDEIARTTSGFSGADLENLMNESAIYAAKENRAFLLKEDIDKAFIKVGIGTEKKSRLVPEKERKITAYHETGHAVLFHLLEGVGPVYAISIIPTGNGAAGYTMPLPENDNVFNTKGKMLQDIKVSLAGRIAEEMFMDDITTGASQDIKQATGVARAMVEKYGMSDALGLINYETENEEETFLGRDIGHRRNVSNAVSKEIDAEVKRIIDECYKEARTILEANKDVINRCASLLLEKERINREEFEALFD